MARFLIDEQLPPALGRLLRNAGHDAVHIYNIDLGAASDDRIWNEALARKAILITKDADFIVRQQTSGGGPPILWIRLGNTSPTELWATVEPALDEFVRAFASGEILIEVA
jgi:predicted nuclease of predicted toxin-antitoxin system